MIKVGAERLIQFDKTLRYKRQQQYNILDYDAVNYEFETGRKRVYKNLNFSIFIDDYCNADCRFCVARLRFEHRSLQYDKKHIENQEVYLRRLDEVLKKVRPLDPSISITGGEPTISPMLTDVLRLVDKYGFRKRTITTNGSGLLNRVGNSLVLDNLIKYGWHHLNISRAHYDDTVNKEIMRYGTDSEYCTKENLRDIIEIAQKGNLKHRLSCILLKQGICNAQQISRYVDSYMSIGADSFIFRELMDYDKNAMNQEMIRYCDDNKIRLNDVWEQMEHIPEFKPYLNILGYYYYVEIYRYLGATVASESADLNQQYCEKEKHNDMVYEMVFHTNGNLCGSWVEGEEILDEYKEG